MLNQNPMSVMAQASKLSIAQLQQAIKNGTVPPYIGVPLLQQKIKESQQAKQAMATQQPQQPPVAQQVMQQAEAQGVDTLPSNLPVQGMAQGGIIAFNKGDVVRDPYDEAIANADPHGYAYHTFMPYLAYPQDIISAGIDKFKSVRDKNKMVVDPETGQPISVAELRNKPITKAAKDVANQYKGIKQPDLGTKAIGSVLTGLQTGEVNPLMADATRGAPAADVKGNASIDSIFADSVARRGAGAGAGSKGIAGYEIKPYTAAQTEMEAALNAEKNPITGNPYTYAEKAEERKARQIAEGVDFNLYGRQKEELEGKKTLSDTRSRLNEAMPYFAFAEQLAQAPKPGETTATALSRALAGAGRTKAEIADKEELRQEKINDKLNNLAVAQNTFNAAQYSGNEESLKEAKAAMKAARANLTALGIKGIDQQNEAAKSLYETQSKERIAREQIGATYYAADKAQHTINNIARTIKKDNPNMTDSEAIQKAYEISNPGFGSIAQHDIASQRTNLTKAIGDIQKQYPMGVAMPADVKARLTAYTNQLNSLGSGGGAAVADTSGDTVESFINKGFKINPTS